MYVLMVLGGDEKKEGVTKFLQSFKLLPAPAPKPIVKTKSL
jgi:hypothetical protein